MILLLADRGTSRGAVPEELKRDGQTSSRHHVSQVCVVSAQLRASDTNHARSGVRHFILQHF